MNLKQIGRNVQKLRLRAELTQAQLAEKIEKSTNHIAHIENGSVKMSVDCMLAICNVVSASPNEIFLGEYPLKEKDIQEFFLETKPYMDIEDQLLLVHISELLSQRNHET